MVTLKQSVLGEAHLSTGQNSTGQSNYNERFPICKFHGLIIITNLPTGCLYHVQDSCHVLLELKNTGFEHISDNCEWFGLNLLPYMIIVIGNCPKSAIILVLRR